MSSNNSSKGMNLLFFLSQFDFLSQKPTLLINNTERIRSLPGASLTMIVWGITIMMSVFILDDFSFSSIPFFISSSSYDIKDYDSFDLNMFPVMFSLLNKDTLLNSGLDGVKLAVNVITHQQTYDKNGIFTNMIISKKALNYTSCKEVALDPIFYKNRTNNYIKNNYYCLSNNDYNGFKFASGSSDGSTIYYSEIKLEIECGVFNCDSLIDEIILSIATLEDFIDIYDMYSPKKKVGNIKSFPLMSASSLNLQIGIKQARINTDIGLIRKVIETFNYNVITLNEVSYFKSNSNLNMISTIIIFQENFQDNVYRHYNKLPLLFAQIGGIYYIIYVIANNFNMIYSVINFYLTIDNSCKISYYITKVTYL